MLLAPSAKNEALRYLAETPRVPPIGSGKSRLIWSELPPDRAATLPWHSGYCDYSE